MKKTLLLLALFSVFEKATAQNIKLNTDDVSIAMEVKNMGFTADIFTTNKHVSATYIVSYTVEFTLKCGGTLTFSKNDVGISAGKTDNCGGYTVAIPDVKGCERGVQSARLTRFKANPINNSSATASNTPQNTGTTYNSSNNTGTVSTNTRPGANATVQELAAWQRSQQPATTNSPQNTANTTRLNNLNALQQQQQRQQQASSDWYAKYQERERQTKIEQQQTDQQVAAVVNVVNSLIGDLRERREEKDRQEQRKRAEAERKREEERVRKEIFETKIANRKSVITEFPVKGIPLGSQEKAPKIYYFLYAYQPNLLTAQYPVVYVSNVFEIGMYRDGTRAYLNTVKNEIASLTPYEEILHGYYYTEQEAGQMRLSLISLLANNDVVINEVAYKGKPGTGPAVSNNPALPANANKYGKSISLEGTKNEQNLAPATLNDPTPREVPKQNLDKAAEEEKYGKKINIEY